MNRRLSKLRTMADLGAMLEQVVASEGKALLILVTARAQTEANI